MAELRAIGLMSGTSMDGVDAALIATDGYRVAEFGPWTTLPYDDAFRDRLRGTLGGTGPVAAVERELTERHAEAVERLLAEHRIDRASIDLIGFHGQTILHRPEQRRTWQIGDGARLAARLRLPVVNDFRSADVAAGGQGAPLAPVYHAALAADLPKPVAVLNLGGVGNVTWIGEGDALLAFDTGPANAPIDDWVRRQTGAARDDGGALAQAGRIDAARVQAVLAKPYFAAPPPKSLDRDDFTWRMADGLSAADGAATLAAIVAATVAASRPHLPAPPRRWLVTGGGRHNVALMEALRSALAVAVDPVEAVGWRGDALEAEAFAFMAVRHRLGLPISFPGTTGVPAPMTGGRMHPAA
ncbi:anhydro-N-acetylmuramic acid kinase [Desertibaculum subflavum]|uniref:anhydro-N-acetylmuramic acid kinase n=1 Tax=Desertibaculum subflavum TaxID=2268458 RepID=UPI003F6777E7